MGVPSALSNVDGNKDLVRNGENGFIIDNFDVNKYVDLTTLIKNKSLYAKFSENLVLDYKEKFNADKNIFKLEETYNSFY